MPRVLAASSGPFPPFVRGSVWSPPHVGLVALVLIPSGALWRPFGSKLEFWFLPGLWGDPSGPGWFLPGLGGDPSGPGPSGAKEHPPPHRLRLEKIFSTGGEGEGWLGTLKVHGQEDQEQAVVRLAREFLAGSNFGVVWR